MGPRYSKFIQIHTGFRQISTIFSDFFTSPPFMNQKIKLQQLEKLQLVALKKLVANCEQAESILPTMDKI